MSESLERAARNRATLANLLGDTWPIVSERLDAVLPGTADPDRALNNLERFLTDAAGRAQVPNLLENDGFETLLQLFSVSQFFADLIIRDAAALDMARIPLRQTPTRDELLDELTTAIRAASDDSGVLKAIRRFRQRQHIRIGVNDIIRRRPLEEITRDLSLVAEACIEASLTTARRTIVARFGEPMNEEVPSRCVVLGFGKLGGEELNYSSDIDLMFVYDADGTTRGKRGSITNDEFYARLVPEVVRLLSAHTDRGQAYRTDLRLRPEGQRGPVARSLSSTLSYYHTHGRTWERQALIKMRPVAGDVALGKEFLQGVESFTYRKYLSFSEINEIKAMKRRIERTSSKAGERDVDVKTGPGGIRDVEFTIQFLQLLNGGELHTLRPLRGTLSAMQALEVEGCLTDPEFRALDEAYRFLRKTEHRLQILFDAQTHRLPESVDELRKLALRMGYVDREFGPPVPPTIDADQLLAESQAQAREIAEQLREMDAHLEEVRRRLQAFRPEEVPARVGQSAQRHSPLDEPPIAPKLETRDLLLDPLEQFLHDYSTHTHLNRTILNHLLHQTFTDTPNAEPEADLILAPDPDDATVRQVLGRYPFRDPLAAYRNLMQLAQEVPFLSSRRCRHFLASIASPLLQVVAATADPDQALVMLEKVTAGLGGKAVLWELFSFHPPSLRLTVDLCANSPFLSQILISNPGMIDELLDSLILNRPRTLADLRAELKELFRGVSLADAAEPILHSFQDKELLRIGVRDLLNKDDLRAVTAALSDLAEAILAEIVQQQETDMIRRYGAPMIGGEPCRYAVIALGKLGGREMSYHSDLDLIVVYEGDGRTQGGEVDAIDSYQYFTEFAQRIIRATGRTGPMGRLYAVDMRLRPTGKSGSLVVPLPEFERYYAECGAQMWERQALTRARVVAGDEAFSARVMEAVQTAIELPGDPVAEIRTMRDRLHANSGPESLKRGYGRVMDVEFLVQLLQLRYAAKYPSIRSPNTWDALDALETVGLLESSDAKIIYEGYGFLRRAEARLRIVTNRPLNDLPQSLADREKFARRLRLEPGPEPAAERFTRAFAVHTQAVCAVFDKILAREEARTIQ